MVNYPDCETWELKTLNEIMKILRTSRYIDSDAKVLGKWFERQLSNYKNEIAPVYKNAERKQLFEKFMDEFPEIFRECKRQRTE